MWVKRTRLLLTGLPMGVSPSKLTTMFPQEQLSHWPKGYRPSARIAFFLYPKGIPLKELIDARAELRSDSSKELHRSFTVDNSLWLRCEFEALVARADEQQRSALKRVLTRSRLPCDADVRKAFDLQKMQPSKDDYKFTSFARVQEHAMAILLPCKNIMSTVQFTDFRQLRNVIYTQYESLSAMRFVAMRSREEILYTQEFVAELALYLRQRLDTMFPKKENDDHQPAKIMTLFGRGRLAAALNDTNVLKPATVVACAPPGQPLKNLDLPGNVLRSSSAFYVDFPLETCTVPDALQRHEPRIVILEPHCDRDWTAEVRGYWSVGEMLMLGPVDSPAMGSFSLPWLSHGVVPGADTFWMYSERLERITPMGKKKFDMPTDAPYVQQNYTKEYVDSLSQWLIYSNDTAQFPNQGRCVSYRRRELPSRPEGIPPTRRS